MKLYLSKYQLVTSVIIMSILSCTEEFNIQLEDREEQTIVVDGMISNLGGPYFIHLYKSMDDFQQYINTENPLYYYNYEYINNAQITIFDDYGTIDTLVPAEPSDDLYSDSTHSHGYYKTTKIKGMPGRTYYLNILWEGKEFTSECTMPQPAIIDTIDFKIIPGPVGKFDKIVPHLYFNPGQNNYFISCLSFFSEMDFSYYPSYEKFTKGFNGLFGHASVLNTYHSNPANGIPLYNTMYKKDPYLSSNWNDSAHVTLLAIDQKIYNFYKDLSKQLGNDGGAFNPTPSSPRSNISNGAQGIFRAISFTDLKMRNTLKDLYN